MRKVIFRIGLVTEAQTEPLALLHASAESGAPGRPREHWLTLSSTVKTLISLAVLASAFITQHTLTSSRLAVAEEAQKTIIHRADLQAEQINALRASVIPREQYYADKAQQNTINLQLANNQQAILLLLARGGAGR